MSIHGTVIEITVINAATEEIIEMIFNETASNIIGIARRIITEIVTVVDNIIDKTEKTVRSTRKEVVIKPITRTGIKTEGNKIKDLNGRTGPARIPLLRAIEDPTLKTIRK